MAGTTINPYRFGGQLGYRQDGANRNYVRARHLDTSRGRWISRDPIGFGGGDNNLYRYAENAPNDLMDPSGLSNCDPEVEAACRCGCALRNDVYRNCHPLPPRPGFSKRGTCICGKDMCKDVCKPPDCIMPRLGWEALSAQAIAKTFSNYSRDCSAKSDAKVIDNRSPCPGTGGHYALNCIPKSGKSRKPTRIASILCCPSCRDTPDGPKLGGTICKVSLGSNRN